MRTDRVVVSLKTLSQDHRAGSQRSRAPEAGRQGGVVSAGTGPGFGNEETGVCRPQQSWGHPRTLPEKMPSGTEELPSCLGPRPY